MDPFDDLIAWFAARESYTCPVLCFSHGEEMIELDPGEDLPREDEERFVEAVMLANGLAIVDTVTFCRHPVSGWRVIAAERDGFRFFHMPEDGTEPVEEPKPDFWAARPVPPEMAGQSFAH